MEDLSIGLNDLPDELLIKIFDKLNTFESPYMGISQSCQQATFFRPGLACGLA